MPVIFLITWCKNCCTCKVTFSWRDYFKYNFRWEIFLLFEVRSIVILQIEATVGSTYSFSWLNYLMTNNIFPAAYFQIFSGVNFHLFHLGSLHMITLGYLLLYSGAQREIRKDSWERGEMEKVKGNFLNLKSYMFSLVWLWMFTERSHELSLNAS